jgi:hypothetical protein
MPLVSSSLIARLLSPMHASCVLLSPLFFSGPFSAYLSSMFLLFIHVRLAFTALIFSIICSSSLPPLDCVLFVSSQPSPGPLFSPPVHISSQLSGFATPAARICFQAVFHLYCLLPHICLSMGGGEGGGNGAASHVEASLRWRVVWDLPVWADFAEWSIWGGIWFAEIFCVFILYPQPSTQWMRTDSFHPVGKYADSLRMLSEYAQCK